MSSSFGLSASISDRNGKKDERALRFFDSQDTKTFRDTTFYVLHVAERSAGKESSEESS